MKFEKDIIHCLETLKNEGIILYPTDTIWGLGCDAINEAAVRKIYRLKKRAGEKSMIILVDSVETLSRYATVNENLLNYLTSTKSPTTIIYPKSTGLATSMLSQDQSIAIRVVKDDFCRELIHRFGKPIVSTSANLSGETAPANFTMINDSIKNGADYIVQHRRDDLSLSQPSALVKWDGGEGFTIIRSADS